MTIQISDMLIWQNTEYSMSQPSLPLDSCFPDVQIPKFESFSSMCWRGYIATWVIDKHDWLRLAKIGTGISRESLPNGDECVTMGAIDQMQNLFPNEVDFVIAHGFTGDILVEYDIDVQGETEASGRQYNYKVFSISKGKLIQIVEHDHAWGLENVFQRRPRTSERLRKFLEEQNK